MAGTNKSEIWKKMKKTPTFKNVTFHEQQECGYGFPSLPLATRASAAVSEWFLSMSGKATSA